MKQVLHVQEMFHLLSQREDTDVAFFFFEETDISGLRGLTCQWLMMSPVPEMTDGGAVVPQLTVPAS